MRKVKLTIPESNWGTIKTKYPNDSIFVQANELTGSSKNFDSTIKGVVTKRLGGREYNPALFSAPAKDQFEAIFTDGTHHLIEVSDGILRFSAGGGTFADVTSGYSSIGNFEFTLYQDRIYFGNGIDTPQVYDKTASYGGVGYSVPQTKDMGAQTPGGAATVALVTGSGSIPDGGHTYKITFLYYGSEESNGGPSSALVTTSNPDSEVDLTSIPIGGYGVTSRKIYRDNNDGNYLLVGTLSDNTTTIFTDDAATGTAFIPTTNDVPPNFGLILTHLDRTWLADLTGDPSTIAHSEAGLPNIHKPENRILCNPQDPITAIVVYQDRIIVINRNSLGQILGRTKDIFRYSEIPSSIGCVDNRSVRVRTVQGVPVLMWLSDKGFYSYNGQSINYISDPIEDLVNFNIQQAQQVKGQNAQTSQSQFQAGTASPGIDLSTIPGTITTPNPKRLWDDEADWDGGSSLTNIATPNDNTLKVPIKFDPLFNTGSLNNVIQSGDDLILPVASNFTGQTAGGGFTGVHITSNTAYVADTVVQRFNMPRAGTLNSFSFSVKYISNTGNPGTIKVYEDLGGVPSSVLFSQGIGMPAGVGLTLLVSASPSISLPAGNFWFGLECSPTGAIFINDADVNTGVVFTNGLVFAKLAVPKLGFQSTGFISLRRDDNNAVVPQLAATFSVTQTPVATTGLWISNPKDSLSNSAVGTTITHTGSYPGGTSAITTIEAADDIDFLVGLVSEAFPSISGAEVLSTVDKRFWRIKIQLDTTDDRVTPTIGPAVLRYATTGTWISESIDHTIDIVSLDSLVDTKTVPAGTSVTLEIATSDDDITYTAFGAIGAAVVKRFSQVRYILTTDGDNALTPTITNTTFKWTLTSNLISSAIDTGNTPAGWDIFQASSTPNGGTVSFFMRTATTAPGLSGESFVAVINGEFPAVPENQFAQWKVEITSSADTVPTVTDVTINWFISIVSSIRVASLFFNRTYYLAAAEFNEVTNNLLLVLDGEGMWRIYRGVNVATMSLFFNDPYFGSSTEGRIVRFLQDNTDQGTNIEMIVETKALTFGVTDKTKIVRKLVLTGLSTGATYTVEYSVDGGTTYIPMLDVDTGNSTFTTSTDNKRFVRRFAPDFAIGNQTAGDTINYKVTNNDEFPAQIDNMKIEVWIREGELLNV